MKLNEKGSPKATPINTTNLPEGELLPLAAHWRFSADAASSFLAAHMAANYLHIDSCRYL